MGVRSYNYYVKKNIDKLNITIKTLKYMVEL